MFREPCPTQEPGEKPSPVVRVTEVMVIEWCVVAQFYCAVSLSSQGRATHLLGVSGLIAALLLRVCFCFSV